MYNRCNCKNKERFLCSATHIELRNSSEGSENMDVTLYQKMYAIVCAAASDAIDLLRSRENILQAQTLLESALLRAEEMYLDVEETATE